MLPGEQESCVSIIECPSYDNEQVLEQLRKCLKTLGSMANFVKPGAKVLLKPNMLGAFSPEEAATTHPALVRAVAILALECGAEVFIGDSPGIGSYDHILRKTGIQAVADELNVKILDFSESCEYEKTDNKIAKKINLTRHLRSIDTLITLPKLKNHAQMLFTGAIKNQFGLVPGLAKAAFHYRLRNRRHMGELMVDINLIARPALAIMDAVSTMEGDGPSGGNSRQLGLLLASDDLLALDASACRIIGIEALDSPPLRAAAERNYGTLEKALIKYPLRTVEQVKCDDFKPISSLNPVTAMLPIPQFMYTWIMRLLLPKPYINMNKCVKCMQCYEVCPAEPKAINPEILPKASGSCIKCHCCHEFCPVKAIELKGFGVFLRRVQNFCRKMISKKAH